MDSNVIHENSIKKWPNRIENNIFKALDKQHAYSYCRTTSSESFDFFSSLQFDNKYISNISSIYVYQQLPLDLARYRDRSGPSCCVWLFEEAKRRLSKPHRHHTKGMGSLLQKTHRSRRNTMWSWFQTWHSSTNTYRTSTVIFFKHHEYFITHLYIVFETEPRKQPMCMWAHALFLGGTKRMTQQEFDVHITLIIISFI